MKTMLVGIFRDRTDAENAVMALENSGYAPADISVIMRDDDQAKEMAKNTGAKVASGAAGGATAGTVIGGLAGILIGIGALSIPGIGQILIGGPIASALGLSGAAATGVAGALTGALAGGFVGALIGLGLSEEDARFYETSIREGAIFISVPIDKLSEAEISDLLTKYNADRVKAINVTLE